MGRAKLCEDEDEDEDEDEGAWALKIARKGNITENQILFSAELGYALPVYRQK